MSYHPMMTRNMYTAIMISMSPSCILLIIIIIIMDPGPIPPALLGMFMEFSLFSYLIYIYTIYIYILCMIQLCVRDFACPECFHLLV